MDTLGLMFAGMIFLAYANGANDNVKGVATLLGSHTLSHGKSLAWATITTLAGSLSAAFFATELAQVFSGKGLVPDALTTAPEFMLAVMLGAALTVLLAAHFGFPISTTHSLVGGLAGAVIAAAGAELDPAALGSNYFMPLAVSPLIAGFGAGILYLSLTKGRQALGITKEACLCIGERRLALAAVAAGAPPAMMLASLDVVVDSRENCDIKAIEVYQGRLLGIGIQRLVDAMHILSAGAVGFARGLNDTPKIVGVALVASTMGLKWITFVAATAMAIGGILQSRKIAKTMAAGIAAAIYLLLCVISSRV